MKNDGGAVNIRDPKGSDSSFLVAAPQRIYGRRGIMDR